MVGRRNGLDAMEEGSCEEKRKEEGELAGEGEVGYTLLRIEATRFLLSPVPIGIH